MPELLCDIIEGIPLPDGCAQVVQAIHLFEHFPRWRAEDVLRDWRRLLAPGGMLILELPDLEKCCRNYLERRTQAGKNPDQLSRWGIYGDSTLRDPFMLHMWGYSPEELMDMLIGCGFRYARHEPTQFHPIGRARRDMRIEATK